MDFHCITFVTAFALAVVTANGLFPFPRSSCPQEDWFNVEMSIMVDNVNTPDALVFLPNVSFFTNIMGWSPEEIQEAAYEAMAFYEERYGLDFSNAVVDRNGIIHLDNVIFYPYEFTPDLGFTVNFNTWIVTGIETSKCYPIRDGGFLVTQVPGTGETILHGTYGGEEGLPLRVGELLLWGFYNIDVSPWQPVIFHYELNTPLRREPIDGTVIFNFDLSHESLGTGRTLGAMRILRTDNPLLLHYVYRATITFPNSVATP